MKLQRPFPWKETTAETITCEFFLLWSKLSALKQQTSSCNLLITFRPHSSVLIIYWRVRVKHLFFSFLDKKLSYR